MDACSGLYMAFSHGAVSFFSLLSFLAGHPQGYLALDLLNRDITPGSTSLSLLFAFDSAGGSGQLSQIAQHTALIKQKPPKTSGARNSCRPSRSREGRRGGGGVDGGDSSEP